MQDSLSPMAAKKEAMMEKSLLCVYVRSTAKWNLGQLMMHEMVRSAPASVIDVASPRPNVGSWPNADFLRTARTNKLAIWPIMVLLNSAMTIAANAG